jgi:hypothetical protein
MFIMQLCLLIVVAGSDIEGRLGILYVFSEQYELIRAILSVVPRSQLYLPPSLFNN